MASKVNMRSPQKPQKALKSDPYKTNSQGASHSPAKKECKNTNGDKDCIFDESYFGISEESPKSSFVFWAADSGAKMSLKLHNAVEKDSHAEGIHSSFTTL